MRNVGLRLVTLNVCRTTHSKPQRGTRRLHTRGELPYPIEGGLGKFLPPDALKTVAIDYQNGLLERLNDEVKGTEEAFLSVTQTIINTATLKEKTLAFNYASLALNNSFFLNQLKPPPQLAPKTQLKAPLTHQAEISAPLLSRIRMQHGSLANLQTSFSAAAVGLFSNGWVWFVTDSKGNTGVLTTLGPGTLLVRSRSYMGYGEDKALGDNLFFDDEGGTENESQEFEAGYFEAERPPAQSPISQGSLPGVPPSLPTSGTPGILFPADSSPFGSRHIHQNAPSRQMLDIPRSSGVWDPQTAETIREGSHPKNTAQALNSGEIIFPLFCLPVYEHAWMSAGFGIWGREAWLKEFWSVLDWKKVSDSYISREVKKPAA